MGARHPGRSITGGLPGQLTVREYAARWLTGYSTAPRDTRVFHETNVAHITAVLGPAPVARVTPSDVMRMLNDLIDRFAPALADRVYRTASAMFASAAANSLGPIPPLKEAPATAAAGRSAGP